MDAMALPFVKGRLANRDETALLDTVCACCGAPLSLEVRSALEHRVLTPGAEPVLTVPLIDARNIRGASIAKDF